MARSVLPFIVENGVGRPDSTSYVSVEEADTYMDRILDSYKSVWLEVDDLAKQQVLVWATQLFDDYIYFPNNNQRYRNTRLSQTQALNFPRAGLTDFDGYAVPYNQVPTFVKRATTQLAFELLKADRIIEPTRGILSANVGSLSITFDPNQSNVLRVIPRSVASIVAPYGGVIRGASGIKSVPLVRG